MAPSMNRVEVKDKEVERSKGWFLSKESWMVQKEESWMVQKELEKQISKSTLTPPFQTDARCVTQLDLYESKLILSATEQTRASNRA